MKKIIGTPRLVTDKKEWKRITGIDADKKFYSGVLVYKHDLYILKCKDGEYELLFDRSDYKTKNLKKLEGLLARWYTQEAQGALTYEYNKWQKENGLNLGSADEHIGDWDLTEEQNAWLKDFVERWDAVSPSY